MKQLNIGEVKEQFFELLDAIESGSESGIIIARRGRPVALMLPPVQEDRGEDKSEGQ